MTIASKIVRRVATIDENKSVLEAIKLMKEEFIGSVVVTSSSGIRRLFTERDVVMDVVGKGEGSGEGADQERADARSHQGQSQPTPQTPAWIS